VLSEPEQWEVFLGGHLQLGGHDVTLIDIWQEHIDTINQQGLAIRKDGKTMLGRCR
jgi:ketopantoate reductase